MSEDVVVPSLIEQEVNLTEALVVGVEDEEINNPLVVFRYSEQFKGWMITGKVSALLSMIGSGLIIIDILRKYEKQHKIRFTNRIMFVLSVSDFCWSFISPFLGTWLVPEGLAFGSAGNQASCTAQGFLAQMLAFWSGTYNTALAVAYLLVVRYQVNNDQPLPRLQEGAIHTLLLSVGVASAIPPLVYDAYNYSGWWLCFQAAAPLGCDAPGSEVPCERGANAETLLTWTWHAWHYTMFAIILGSMLLLYWTVSQQERAGDRYSFNGMRLNRKQSKKVAMKGIFYVGAFVMTWLCYDIIFFMNLANTTPPIWLLGANSFFVPLQGFFNAIVYFQTQITSIMCCCCRKNKSGNTSGRPRQPSSQNIWSRMTLVRTASNPSLLGSGVGLGSSASVASLVSAIRGNNNNKDNSNTKDNSNSKEQSAGSEADILSRLSVSRTTTTTSTANNGTVITDIDVSLASYSRPTNNANDPSIQDIDASLVSYHHGFNNQPTTTTTTTTTATTTTSIHDDDDDDDDDEKDHGRRPTTTTSGPTTILSSPLDVMDEQSSK